MLAVTTDSNSGSDARVKGVVRLWLRLSTCQRSIEQRLRSHLQARFGITLPQFEVLFEVNRSGSPVAMSRLSEQLQVTGSNITGVVDRLERKKLVKRFRSNIDRRVQHIRMTNAGSEEYELIAADVSEYLAAAFAELSDEDILEMKKLLQKTSVSAAHGPD
jgi:DNA-binding MarR family transcriptional regulator